ncbi:MAG TPA: aspartate/glutamate racemase family protein [Candidatus Baltobacteraceae bacterium]|jgi:aspartate racemase|nr:aspartate/glutamate racemase family protein [Candidatus Baltobacteraceae bacterium]
MRFGLVVGLGTAAGIFYYRRLVQTLDKRGSVPELLLAHADVGRVFEFQRATDFDGLSAYLAGILRWLAGAGCAEGAVCAVSPHVCIAQLRQRSPIPIVDVLEVVRAALKQRGYSRVALFGARRVIETDLFGAIRDCDVVRPSAHEIDEIDCLYTTLVSRGAATPEERDAINHLGAAITERERLDAIVFAGTDLSAVYEGVNFDFPILDVAEEHVAAIAGRVELVN